MAQLPKNDQPIRLWGGRFTGATDPLMDQYNESLSIDRVFYAQDIKGSIAYARANVKTGILTKEEFETIERGLREVLQEWEEGKFVPAPGDEGKQSLVHMPFILPLGHQAGFGCINFPF
jgi:argininosuccinate lyase